VVAFAVIVMTAAILVMKFAHHPGVWLLALTASIPMFAAIAGAFLNSTRSDEC
jgi:hypothetical protein